MSNEPHRHESKDQPGIGREETVNRATEIAVRFVVVGFIVYWCFQIVAPFIGIVAWALIIAIGSAKPYESFARAIGGRTGLAATLFVTLGLAVMIVPAVLLSETLVSGSQQFAKDVVAGTIQVPPPSARVADWPVVGGPIYETWSLASENLTEAATALGPQLKAVSAWLLEAAGSAGVGLLQLIASLILAGVLLSRGADQADAIASIASRIAGTTRGPELAKLARATVSSVVQGIVGVAVVQAVLAGAGFVIADVPAAGLWALLVLVAAIIQLPVAIVMIAPVLIVFSAESGPFAIAFAAWCAVVALVDNLLKPMLFGRGVEVPTVVIFIGAIGGMLSMGIIGLFVGAVVLAVGYELFRAWLAESESATQP
jgi:predicted PurR-regulated permease PerM